ncbi:sensor histidine kinase [Paenibacillus nanensis]|uniref:histidine kinase n=1 Tax=Paenibacillus nanensis TaxID=393251 RepID=A0A3A1UZK3_9BACL|nr:histidine kinase [Paenibacillus nanensis]RIX53918.1 sensor histidine kinase [Paenibacillus nanensis]
MSYRSLRLLTVVLPTLIIGGFEYIRHELFPDMVTMSMGNLLITLLTLIISYLFSLWMFRIIERKNQQIAEEKTRGAVYEERERIARELHDHIAQILFFLNVKMNQGKVDEAKAAISEIDHHLRQAIFNLRSSPDEGLSYSDRLTKWLDEWSVLSGVKVSKSVRIPAGFFSTSEEVQLFAIIQEAFTNIRKHSQASHAEIRFIASASSWLLEVRDNGIGPIDSHTNGSKYGLSLIKKRADDLHATFDFIAEDHGGAKLLIQSEGKSDVKKSSLNSR